ncbi:MAG: tetratricopeptide repeat protein [Synechococcaceae cyanobacterium RM1_1_27]|nr:tetratricopeptide repeat protein [Synechococcaceae cyanobacterium SM2_3_2]NJO86268.1 tetratricopeptide repeat protein [Synechococcaceae cyanobacterium RM1_1_27]
MSPLSRLINRLRCSWDPSWFKIGILGVVTVAFCWILGTGALAQQPGQIPNPDQFRAIQQPDNPISFSRAEELSAQADAALAAQNYDEAIRLLQQVFDAFNARSNHHQELSRVFAGIQNQISEAQRDLARASAENRDQAAYDLAIVYRAAGRSDQAVAQLVQVVGSQGPTRPLGRDAYQQLYEIGFTTIPFEG